MLSLRGKLKTKGKRDVDWIIIKYIGEQIFALTTEEIKHMIFFLLEM